jgi:hypothetical protein
MPVQTTEIWVKGQVHRVPSVEIEGRTVLSRGKWIKTAAIRDQDVAEGELVKDPATFVAQLRRSGLKADVLTFFQRPPDLQPKFPYHYDMENLAAVPITTFNDWWESLPQEARKNTRRSAKRGVTVRVVPFDDELVRGIHKLCDETPVRQGKPFWHYGKDFETIKKAHATYLERSDFIGAYFENQLIGFIKLVYVDRLALIFHILAFNDHYDKRPLNALLTKAMEVCAQKGVGYFVYGQYVYGNKTQSTLMEFKRRNGFQKIDYPTYYIPLTWKGWIYVRLRLYRGLVGLLPAPVLRRALALRDWLHEKRQKEAPAPKEAKED